MGGADPGAGGEVRLDRGGERRDAGEQLRLDVGDVHDRLPPRHRQALQHQSYARPRCRTEPARVRHLVHGVLVRAAAVDGLPPSLPGARRHHADGRLGPVGQHHRWGGADPTGGKAHAMAAPLLTKADGTKFGKTEGGSIWLDAKITSPYAFHQFFLASEDSMVGTYLRVFSPRSREEIEDLERQTSEAPHLRAAQRALADDVTDLVHREPERRAAVAAADALFGRGSLQDLPAGTLRAVARELNASAVPSLDGLSVAMALQTAGVVPSLSAGRRAIAEGGAYVNNAKVTDADAALTTADLLPGGYVVVRRGKRTVGALSVQS